MSADVAKKRRSRLPFVLILLALVVAGGFMGFPRIVAFQERQMGHDCRPDTNFAFWGGVDAQPSQVVEDEFVAAYADLRLNGERPNSMYENLPNVGCWTGIGPGVHELTYLYEGSEVTVTLRLVDEKGYVGSRKGIVVPDPGGSVEIVSENGEVYRRREQATYRFLEGGGQ